MSCDATSVSHNTIDVNAFTHGAKVKRGADLTPKKEWIR